jgi:hypothetical protein
MTMQNSFVAPGTLDYLPLPFGGASFSQVFSLWFILGCLFLGSTLALVAFVPVRVFLFVRGRACGKT